MRNLASVALLLAAAPLVGDAAESQAAPAMSDAALAALDPTRLGRLVCRGLDVSGSTLGARLALAREFAAQGAEPGRMGLYSGVGQTDLPLGDIDPLARKYFEQGLMLAYGFNHAAAIRSFQLAREISPDCAMCWWGEAMANGPNINAGMADEQNRQALASLEQAQRLAGSAEGLIQALIAAQATRYSATADPDRGALDKAYADAMLALARAHPQSDDLAILAAEAAMNTTPWDYWDAASGEPRARIGEAVALVETVMARKPDHPQASHLYIHLLELPEPKRAEAAADRLRATGPAAFGHLVHMPSHIYYRIGRYADSKEANIKAAAADEAYLAQIPDDGLMRFGYYPHNVHFLLTSAQMMGDVRTVVSQSAKLAGILDLETARRLPWIQAIYAAPLFAQAQYGSKDAILAATADPLPLDYLEAMRRYARSVGMAAGHDRAGFEQELAALVALADSQGAKALEGNGFPAPLIIRLAAEVAQGRMAMASSRPRDAIAHFARATEMQRDIPYNEPPYWYYPVSQSLGAAYFAAGRYDEARQAFRAALVEAPNSGMALYGLARAEEALGHGKEAQAARESLRKVWQGEAGWLTMERI